MTDKSFRKKIKSHFLNKSPINHDDIMCYVKEDEFLSFLISVIFPDFQIQHTFHNNLDDRIVMYIIKHFFKIRVNYSNTDYNKNYSNKLFNLILILERKYKKIVKIAPDFIDRIIFDLDIEYANNILKYQNKLTRLIKRLVEIRKGLKLNDYMKDYHIFYISKNLDYFERQEFLSENKIDIKRLFKHARRSDEALLLDIFNIYPEFYAHKPIIKKDRLIYFTDPLMLQNYDLIRCISIAQPYFIINSNQSSNDNKHIKNMNLLFKMIIIENHLHRDTRKFCKKILQSFVIDTPEIIGIMLHRTFNVELINDVVKYTPSFYSAFDLAVQLYAVNKHVFYSSLIKALMQEYPLLTNFKKIVDNKEVFNDEFVNEVEQILHNIEDK